MRFRKGDVVSIRGVIEYNEDKDSPNIFIKIPGAINSLMLNGAERIAANLKLEIPQFSVGELVSFKWMDAASEERESVGRILAISDGHAWIDRAGGEYSTRLLTTINRIDQDDADE